MALVTVELRHLLLTDFKLFDFTYQITDSAWKDELEQAIIDYYFFEEIGQETPDRFKHVFATKMKSIMPYYDKIYQLNLEALADGFTNNKMVETINNLLTNSGSDESTSNATQDVLNTEYPQHTSILDDIPSGRSSNTGLSNATVNFGKIENRTIEKVLNGYTNQTPVELLQKYKNNLIRINGLIIQELKPCFILIY